MISIVIPAYNEQYRLPPFLEELLARDNLDSMPIEIIVVNDGSTDLTAEIVKKFQARFSDKLKLFSLDQNRGKGAAVSLGVYHATGDYVIMMDADGAYSPEYIHPAICMLKSGADLVLGQREKPDITSMNPSRLFRFILGRSFNLITKSLLRIRASDTQCGFKAGKNNAMKQIFDQLKEAAFGFDIEIILRAQKFGFKIETLSVNARNSEGTRVKILSSSISMLMTVLRIKFNKEKN
ncbi:MAG: glycosyltransferase [SAR324 cluster bacterium]|uniref:Glycosyltransferase n=1 Tax=SAR324 cluster bacterium TaxID=2024889 RepID=A0A7X9FRF1_9DELT|nr:glycosyltransferase [SAR324 cluster bacterium]